MEEEGGSGQGFEEFQGRGTKGGQGLLSDPLPPLLMGGRRSSGGVGGGQTKRRDLRARGVCTGVT